MATKIYSYKAGSEGARNLADALNVKILKREGSKYKPKAGDTVINWGNGELPNFGAARVLNDPNQIRLCSNKLTFFNTIGSHPNNPPRVPDWTDDQAQAAAWIADGKKVVCRTKLQAHSGEGIVIAETVDQLVRAPLYTMYVPKKDEYRLHFMKDRLREGGVMIDCQRKAKRNDVDNPNWAVRNLAGGFVYARLDVDCPADVVGQARRAFELSGLDFGAVDIIYNQKHDQAYVLEINTAPGISGTTVENYTNAFRNLIG